jgi:DNA-binding CsgD family transcriptional regulator
MQLIPGPSGELVLLSPRERSLVRLVVRGSQNKEIAYRLRISKNTVRNHLSRLTGGLGLHSRVDLIAWVLSRPLALAGYAVSRSTHPEGCLCGSPYCSAFSLVDRAA